MNSLYIRFSRHIGVASIASLSIHLRNLLLVPVLTRMLGAPDYGVWVQIFACSELFLGIALLGLNQALSRFLPRRREAGALADDFASMLVAILGAGLALAALGASLSDEGAALFLDTRENALVLKLSFGLIPVSAVSNLVLSYFRASRQIVRYAGLLLLESCGYIGLAIAFVMEGYGVYGVIGALLILRFSICLIGGGIIFRQIGFSRPTFVCLRPFLAFSLPLVPLGIFTWIINVSDRYVLAFFWGTKTAGIYAVSYGLGSMVGLFFSPLFFVLGPALAELWETRNWTAIYEHLNYAQKYPLLVAIPFAILLTVYARDIIGFWATREFLAHPGLIALTALGIISMNLSNLVETALALVYRTRIIPVIYLGCAVFNIISNILVVPFWGMMGAAMTTLLAYGLQLLLMYLYIRRLFPFTWNWPFISRCAIASGAMLICLFFLRDTGLFWRIAGLFIGPGVFVGILALLGGFESREWDLLKRLIGLERS